MGCAGSRVFTWLGAPSLRHAGKMQPGGVSRHTPSTFSKYGVSRASGFTIARLSWAEKSNFAVSASPAGICLSASVFARSCMSRMNGCAKCAECRLM